MMKSARIAAWGIACLLALAGCPGQLDFTARAGNGSSTGQTPGTPPPAVPPRPDAGRRGPDAGLRAVDAGRRGPDAGSRRDAGLPPPPDAGNPAVACTTTEQAIARVLRPKCGMCHDATVAMLSGGLDVVGVGVRDRLRQSSGICMGRAFVVSAPAVGGYFFDKLGNTPPCGTRMPPVGPALDASDIECLRGWIRANP
jgi:hypothetical protein